MRQRFVGRSGLQVSRIGLGTMTWGRDTDEYEAREQLTSFVDAGGTLLDTAASYGASEELVGALIGEVVARDDVVLATKAGIVARGDTWTTDVSRGRLLTTLDRSLSEPARHGLRRPVADPYLAARASAGRDTVRG